MNIRSDGSRVVFDFPLNPALQGIGQAKKQFLWYHLSMIEMNKKQEERIIEICNKYGIIILLLFGSQATGQVNKESDADLAFFTNKKSDFETEAKLNSELQDVFGDIKVETVDLRKASPLLLKQIMDNHLPLFVADKKKYFEIQSYAIKSYIETKPLRDYLSDYLNTKYA